MCNEVKNQLSELLGWLSDWQEQLVLQCDYKSDVAWKFLGVVFWAIFDHLATPRMEIAGLSDLSSTTTKAAVVWAMMQAHVVVNDIIDQKKAHHVVTTSVSNFIMKTRVDRSHVDDALSKASDSAKTASALEKRIVALETDLKSAKQQLGNKIAAVEKKK